MKSFVVSLLLAFAVLPQSMSAQSLAKTDAKPGVKITAASDLEPKSEHAKVDQVVTAILTRMHYRRLTLNDSLSSAIYDRYLQSVDFNRSYFLSSDISGFEQYRFTLDDAIKKGDIAPAYEIFNVFKHRAAERGDYAENLLKKEFDYGADETFETNREKMPWAKDIAELNDVWRKTMKNQALGLKLSGKKWDETSKTLHERLATTQKALQQYTSEEVFQLYMNAFANSIDPHTNYFSPATADNFKMNMSLSLEGIGARLQTEGDYTKVNEIVPGGPAFKSGLIKANDKITAVAQGDTGKMRDVIGWRIDDVVSLIRGAKGTVVRLQIIAAEAVASAPPKEIRLVREKVKLEDQAAKREVLPLMQNGKSYKLGVITIPSFYRDFEAAQRGDKDFRSTTRDVRKFLAEFESEKIDGLIIDLRNDGGGSLQEATELTGLFIPEGPVVQVRNANGSVRLQEDDDAAVIYKGPVAVMVNRFSASASEIFAAAIQDYKRGLIIGETTYGKGTVQELVDLERFLPSVDGKVGQVKLTTAKFYRITGSSTQHKGVVPDIELPSAFNPDEFGESSEPSALPWDEIAPARFVSSKEVNDAVISRVAAKYKDRMKSDQTLKDLAQDAEDQKKARKNTVVSLQEVKRKKERDDAEAKRLARLKFEGKAEVPEKPKTPATPTASEARKDTYLKEGARILAD
ncbi:MAG: carboxy terminal-processing peptidase, partial [Rhizobacter sp.]|nr:carboxy terminal-processing peptidase [Chlorobiales bacterium]